MPGHAKSYIGNSVKGSFEEFGLRIVSRSGLAKIQGMVIAVVMVIAAFAVYYIAMPTPTPKPPTATTTAATEVIPDDIAAIVKQLPTYYPKDYWKTIAAAKQEGKLVIYHNLGLEQFNPLMEGFRKMYPFIKVDQMYMASAKVWDKYNAEMSALGRTGCDIMRAGSEGYLGLVTRGELMYYVTPEQPYMPKGQYLEGYLYPDRSMSYGIMYDKTKLPPERVPKNAEDFVNKLKADPEYWKGKTAIFDPRFSLTGWLKYYMLRKYIGKDKTLDWYKTIVKSNTVLTASQGPITERMVAGELLAMWDASMGDWASNAFGPRQLTNLEFKIWEDFPILAVQVNWVAPKNGGGHLNAAKLWMDFILSLQGQEIVSTFAVSTRGDYLEKGVRTPFMNWWEQNVVKTGLESKMFPQGLFPQEMALEYMTVKDEWLADWEKATGFK